MAQVSKTKTSSGNNKPAAPTMRTHTVRKGETLSSVAKKYGCTVAEIKCAEGDSVMAEQLLVNLKMQ